MRLSPGHNVRDSRHFGCVEASTGQIIPAQWLKLVSLRVFLAMIRYHSSLSLSVYGMLTCTMTTLFSNDDSNSARPLLTSTRSKYAPGSISVTSMN